MLGDISVVDNIYIVCGTTDMRKSIDGLCSIVRDKLSMDPDQSSLFLFCGKRCDRIKVLLHESDGYVLLYKRLSVAQGRCRWPRKRSGVQAITWRQLDWLLNGLDIEQPKAIRTSRKIHREMMNFSGDIFDENVDNSFSFYPGRDNPCVISISLLFIVL